LRDILRIRDDIPHRDAEKESVIAAPLTPSYGTRKTLFNSMVEDPRFLAREAEWFSMSLNRQAEYIAKFCLSACPYISAMLTCRDIYNRLRSVVLEAWELITYERVKELIREILAVSPVVWRCRDIPPYTG
jgi:hypothetical protein